MAFLRKAGSILRQTTGRQMNSEICGANPSIFNMIRCMSGSKVFVGGLSWNTNEQSLEDAFRKYGDVQEAKVVTDRETQRSRGFGFVTFATAEEASAAIQALDDQELDGRRVRVNYATEKPRYGGGGGGYGGGGGGYGGGDGGYSGGGGGGGYGGGGGGYGGGGGGNYGGGGGNYGGGGGIYGGGGGGNYGGGDNYNQGGGNYEHNSVQGSNFASGSGEDLGAGNQGGDFGADTPISEPGDYANRA